MELAKYWMHFSEIIKSLGMNAIKNAIIHKIDTSNSYDESLMDQYGIIDDLWITDNGGLMLYRELRLKKPWEMNLIPNGHTYWSTSNIGAAAYDASAFNIINTVDVKIIAELPANEDVNWNEIWETILHFRKFGEDELRLHRGTTLIIRKIYVDGEEVESSWIGKTLIS